MMRQSNEVPVAETRQRIARLLSHYHSVPLPVVNDFLERHAPALEGVLGDHEHPAQGLLVACEHPPPPEVAGDADLPDDDERSSLVQELERRPPQLVIATHEVVGQAKGSVAFFVPAPLHRGGGGGEDHAVLAGVIPMPPLEALGSLIQELYLPLLTQDAPKATGEAVSAETSGEVFGQTGGRGHGNRRGTWAGQLTQEQASEFLTSLHVFSDLVSEVVKTESSGLHIRKPDRDREVEQKLTAYQRAAADGHLVAHYEEIVEDWCDVVEELLSRVGTDEQAVHTLAAANGVVAAGAGRGAASAVAAAIAAAAADDRSGPDSETEHWRTRVASLTSVVEQTKSRECKAVVGVLTAAKSKVLRRWKPLDTAVMDSANEARDNLKYVLALEKHTRPLYTGTPTEMGDALPGLLSSVKTLGSVSRYYSSADRLTALLAKCTFQMVARCIDHIDGSGADLWSQPTAEVVGRMKDCLRLFRVYQDAFRAARERATAAAAAAAAEAAVTATTGGNGGGSGGVVPGQEAALSEAAVAAVGGGAASGGGTAAPKGKVLDVSEQAVFSRMDLFCRRVEKLMDLFATLEQFQTLEAHRIEGMSKLLGKFFSIVDGFRRARYRLLDHTHLGFDRDYIEFSAVVAETEAAILQFVNHTFDRASSTSAALQMLRQFQAIMQRSSLRDDLETKFLIIFHKYSGDLDAVQATYEACKQTPPAPRHTPPVTGAITWARHLLARIEGPMHTFTHNGVFMGTREAKKVVKSYNRLARTLVEYELVWGDAWAKGVDAQRAGLSATLLVRHPETRQLVVNLDPVVLQLCAEAKALVRLGGVTVPEKAQLCLFQLPRLKTYHARLQHLVREMQRIVQKVPPVVRQLLRPHLGELERRLNPGLVTLTWTSMNIDGFLHSVHSCLTRVADLVDRVRDVIDNRIERNLKAIAAAKLLDLADTDGKGGGAVTASRELLTHTQGARDRRGRGTRKGVPPGAGSDYGTAVDTGGARARVSSHRLDAFVASQERRSRAMSAAFAARNGEVEDAVRDLIDLVSTFPLSTGGRPQSRSGGAGVGGPLGSDQASEPVAAVMPKPPLSAVREIRQHYSRLVYRAVLTATRAALRLLQVRVSGRAVLLANGAAVTRPGRELVRGSANQTSAATGDASPGLINLPGTSDGARVAASGGTGVDGVGAEAAPFFDVDVELAVPSVALSPTIDEVQAALNGACRQLLGTARALHAWGVPSSTSGAHSVFDSLAADGSVVQLVLLLTGSIERLRRNVQACLHEFRRFDWLWKSDMHAVYAAFNARRPSVEDYDRQLSTYAAVEAEVGALPSTVTIGALRLHTAPVRASLRAEVGAWKAQYARALHLRAAETLSAASNEVSERDHELRRDVTDMEALRQAIDSIDLVREAEQQLEEKLAPVEGMYAVLSRHGVRVPPAELEVVQSLRPGWRRVSRMADQVRHDIALKQPLFQKSLQASVRSFATDTQQLRAEFDQRGPGAPGLQPTEALNRLRSFVHRVADKETRAAQLRSGEALFGLPSTTFGDLSSVRLELDELVRVYSLYEKVEAAAAEWMATPWTAVAVREEGVRGGVAASLENAFAPRAQRVSTFGGNPNGAARSSTPPPPGSGGSSSPVLEAIDISLQHFLVEAKRLPAPLRELPAFAKVRAHLDTFERILPTLRLLARPETRSRHWTAVMGLVKKRLAVGSSTFCIRDLAAAQIASHVDAIAELAEDAKREYAVEARLLALATEWGDAMLPLGPYRDRGALVLRGQGLAALSEALDESQMALALVLQQRHVIPFREEVVLWAQRLGVVAETLETWASVQATWLYLEPIFAAADIARQLPREAKRFALADRSWCKLMAEAGEARNALAFCAANEWLPAQLAQLARGLESCQRALSGYLDRKRAAFPRFFFLADSQLLELLSRGSEPEAIQLHLPSLFEAVATLSIRGVPRGVDSCSTPGSNAASRPTSARPARARTHVNALPASAANMLRATPPASHIAPSASANRGVAIVRFASADGQSLPLTQPVIVEPSAHAEVWLASLLEGTRLAVQAAIHTASSDVDAMPTKQFVHTHVSQVLSVCYRLVWAYEGEDALRKQSGGERGAISSAHRRHESRIADLAAIASVSDGELERGATEAIGALPAPGGGGRNSGVIVTPSANESATGSHDTHPPMPSAAAVRAKVEALIVVAVHQRDAFEAAVSVVRGRGPSDFAWQSNLRVQWDTEATDPRICVVDATIPYGNEFQKCKEQIVVTPLSERCYVALTQAMRLCLVGAAVGPAGTGKTETIKALGSAVGRWVLVTNCSDGQHSGAMGTQIKGLVQSGCWGCFDEFNRIALSHLALIGQQMASVLAAVRRWRSTEDRRSGATRTHSAGLDRSDRPIGPLAPSRRNSISESTVDGSDLLSMTTQVRGPRFNFVDGSVLTLEPNSGMFATLNPASEGLGGYGGRQELPDSVKLQLRVVAMAAPDGKEIVRVQLFAAGFSEASALSRKLDVLQAMCSQQLSKQPQYDWGLRAAKAIVLAAAERRRQGRVTPAAWQGETATLARVARELTLPRLCPQDESLYLALLDDVFGSAGNGPYGAHTHSDFVPSCSYTSSAAGGHGGAGAGCTPASGAAVSAVSDLEGMPATATGTRAGLSGACLHRAIEGATRALCLLPTGAWVTKALQLFDAASARHSVMLVGHAGTGKTSLLRTYFKAMSEGDVAGEDLQSTGSNAGSRASSALGGRSPACSRPVSGNVATPRRPPSGSGARPGRRPSASSPPIPEESSRSGRRPSVTSLSPVVEDGAQVAGTTNVVPPFMWGRQHKEYKLFPRAQAPADLFGSLDSSTLEWTDGALPAVWRRALRDTRRASWLVMDGPVDPEWAESLNSAMDESCVLTLPNAERLPLIRLQMTLGFETDSLAHASPATVSRSAVVHVNGGVLRWEPCAHALLVQEIGHPDIANAVMDHFRGDFETCMDFVFSECAPMVPLHTQAAAQSIAALAAAQLLRLDTPMDADWLSVHRYYIYALVWTVGSVLDLGDRAKFDAHLRNLHPPPERQPGALTIQPALLPPLDADRLSIFDYALTVTGTWTEWRAVVPTWLPEDGLAPTELADVFPSIFVPTADNARADAVLALAADAKRTPLLIGPAGVGKTALAHEHARRLDVVETAWTAKPVCGASTPRKLQRALETHLERRQGRALGPAGGKEQLLFIVDDLHAAPRDAYGTSACAELLRLVLTTSTIFDADRPGESAALLSVRFVFAMRTRAGGIASGSVSLPNDRHSVRSLPVASDKATAAASSAAASFVARESELPVSARTMRLCHLVGLTQPTAAALTAAFTPVLEFFLDGSNGALQVVEPEVEGLAPMLAELTTDVWARVASTLRPTPAVPHYNFSTREVVRVVHALLCARVEGVLVNESSTLGLWMHEASRVFADATTTDADREAVDSDIAASLSGAVGQGASTELLSSPWYWCDFLNADARKELAQFGAGGDISTEGKGSQQGTGVSAPLRTSSGVGNRAQRSTAQRAGNSLRESLRTSSAGSVRPTSGMGTTSGAQADSVTASGLVLRSEGGLNRVQRSAYEFTRDIEEVADSARACCERYNAAIATKAEPVSELNLLFFDLTVEHLMRVTRVLRIPGLHALLVGVGGSGKRSLAKLAAYVSGSELIQPRAPSSPSSARAAGGESGVRGAGGASSAQRAGAAVVPESTRPKVTTTRTSTFPVAPLLDALRDAIKNAGLYAERKAVLITEAELQDDCWLEQINSLLYSGELSADASTAGRGEAELDDGTPAAPTVPYGGAAGTSTVLGYGVFTAEEVESILSSVRELHETQKAQRSERFIAHGRFVQKSPDQATVPSKARNEGQGSLVGLQGLAGLLPGMSIGGETQRDAAASGSGAAAAAAAEAAAADIPYGEGHDSLAAVVAEPAVPPSREDLWRFFIGRARAHIHVLICSSPAAGALSSRAEAFPTLFATTYIDWFRPWPEPALIDVASRLLDGFALEGIAAAVSAASGVEQGMVASGIGSVGARRGSVGHGDPVMAALGRTGRRTSLGSSTAQGGRRLSSQALAATAREEGELADMVSQEETQTREALFAFFAATHGLMRTVSLENPWPGSRRPRAHVTPKAFLSAVDLYKTIYARHAERLKADADLAGAGLKRLHDSAGEVELLREELDEKEKGLALAHERTSGILQEIVQATTLAERKKREVAAVAEACSVDARGAEEQRLSIEAELAITAPVLKDAEEAIHKITQRDIASLKSMRSPPELIKRLFDCVLILRKYPLSDRLTLHQPKPAGPYVPMDSWVIAAPMLADQRFLDDLLRFRKEELNEEILELLWPYLTAPDFTYTAARNSSGNVAGLCIWVRALAAYAEVQHEVRPQRAALAQTEAALAEHNARLGKAEKELQECQEELDKHQAEFDRATAKRTDIEAANAATQRRIDLATQLVNRLGDERARWQKTAETAATQLRQLTAHAAIAAAFVTYLGPYPDPALRAEVVAARLRPLAEEHSLPVSDSFDARAVVDLLADSDSRAGWVEEGLPGDKLSVQNGAIVTATRRWPLIIDPQGQARTWISAHESAGGVRSLPVASNSPGVRRRLVRALERYIPSGTALMLEGDPASLDPMLQPLLARELVRRGATGSVRAVIVGDTEIEWHSAFRLYVICTTRSPTLCLELHAQLCVVDFSVSFVALEEQLLAIAIRAERPDLEVARTDLVARERHTMRVLRGIERKLLEDLAQSHTSLLADETVLDQLHAAKQAAAQARVQLQEEREARERIAEARLEYAPLAARGAALFLSLTELSHTAPLFTAEAGEFLRLYARTIAAADSAALRSGRVANIVEALTWATSVHACRGLFDRQRRVWTLLVALRVEIGAGRVSMAAVRALLLGTHSVVPHAQAGVAPAGAPGGGAGSGGGQVSAGRPPEQPIRSAGKQKRSKHSVAQAAEAQLLRSPVSWLSDGSWQTVLAAVNSVPALADFGLSLPRRESEWRSWLEQPTPETAPLPDIGDPGAFARLLVIRALRPDRFPEAASAFTAHVLGKKYADPPRRGAPSFGAVAGSLGASGALGLPAHAAAGATAADELAVVDSETDAERPILVVTADGVDPSQTVRRAAAARGADLTEVMLGPGMEVQRARSAIADCRARGRWLVLYDAHLALPFLAEIEGDLAAEEEARSTETTLAQAAAKAKTPAAPPVPPPPQPVRRNTRIAAFAAGVGQAHALAALGVPGAGTAGAVGAGAVRRADDEVSHIGTGDAASTGDAADLGEAEEAAAAAARRRRFRLWLCVRPVPAFPAGLLARSARVTAEAPTGLRAALRTAWCAVDEESLEVPPHLAWKQVAYSVCMLHAVLRERSRFGSLGFSAPYDWSPADLSASLAFAHTALAAAEKARRGGSVGSAAAAAAAAALSSAESGVDWESLRFLVGEIHYGGHVTDRADAKVVAALCSQWLSPALLSPGFTFGAGHAVPSAADHLGIRAAIDRIPAHPDPNAVGLHPNASISASARAAADTLCPGAAGEDTSQAMLTSVAEAAARLPAQLFSAPERATALRMLGGPRPVNLALVAEMETMDALLALVRGSVRAVQTALNGGTPFTAQLRDVLASVAVGRVPLQWREASRHTCGAALGPWLAALHLRSEQLSSLAKGHRSHSIWVTGLFNPQAIVAAVVQEVARRHAKEGWALDSVAAATKIMAMDREEVRKPPDEGIYLHGLHLEGCRWDKQGQRLTEPLPRVLVSTLPVLHVTAVATAEDPRAKSDSQSRFNANLVRTPPDHRGGAASADNMMEADAMPQFGVYVAPCFKSPRRGSAHHVFDIDLRTDEPVHKWVLRGACALTSLEE